MNCKTVHRRLLALQDPTRVPASVREHLALCPACRQTQRHLARIETGAALMTAPSSSFAKAAALRRLHAPPRFTEKVSRYVATLPGQVRGMGRMRLAGAGLAAALLLCVAVWQLALRPGNPTVVTPRPLPAERDPLLANLFQRNLALAQADTARPRVEALAGIADDLSGAASGMARAVEARDTLRDVAGLYEQVVKGEVRRAAALPADQRQAVLGPLTQRLQETAHQTDALADEIYAPEKHPLRVMAAAARAGKDKLDALQAQSSLPMPTHRGVALACASPSISFTRLLIGPLAAGVAAKPETSAPVVVTPAEETRRFRRNYDLIKVVVEGSLSLAEEHDPVRRAATCTLLARSLVSEIQKAAADHEGPRAEEMGLFLRNLLQKGIAPNLTAASGQTPKGSMQEKELLQVGSDVAGAVQPLKEQLEKAADAQDGGAMERTLQAVFDGRSAVERVFQARDAEPKPQIQPRLETQP